MRVFYDNFKVPREHDSIDIPEVYAPFFITGSQAVGVPSPLQALAIFVAPPETVMGLAAWKDVVEWESDLDDERRRFFAQEEAEKNDSNSNQYSYRNKHALKKPPEWATGRVLCTLYDIEKMLRMYLHGSTLIYDYLVIVKALEGVSVNYYIDFAPKILESLTNDRHFYALLNESLIERKGSAVSLEEVYEPMLYDDVVKLGAAEYLRRLRRTLQAVHLSRFEHRVNLRDMLQELDGTTWPLNASADEILPLLNHDALMQYTLDAIQSKPTWEPGGSKKILPPTPNNFKAADYWLTRSRLKMTLA